jgi:hypothetical protein
MERRQFLSATAAVTAASASSARAADAPSLRGPYLDLSTGKGNMLLRVRMAADLDETKIKFGGVSGIVTAVREKEKLRDLFGFEVIGVARAEKQPDGSYRSYHREVVLYTDLATGEVLDEYVNPFTEERVRVVHVVNDPWNEHFEEFERRPPTYGGLNQVEDGPRKPLLMNWRDVGNGMIMAMRNIHLYYKSALQPDKWPRESSGPMNRVSETYTYLVNLADAQNPAKTSVRSYTTWSRTTPWLPWMLMGQAPGHVQYHSISAYYPTVDSIRKPLRDYTLKHFPQMLEPPPRESWEKPNLSSLEVYALTQKPAPAKS